MKIPRFILAAFSCWTLMQDLSFAQTSAATQKPLAPQSPGQSTQTPATGDQAERKHSDDKQTGNQDTKQSGEPGVNKARGVAPPVRGERAEKGGSRPSERKGQANAKGQRRKPRSSSEPVKQVPGDRQHLAGARGDMDQTKNSSKPAPDLHQSALSQPAGAPKAGLVQNPIERQPRRPAVPPSLGQLTPLAVKPAHNQSSALSVIGGPAASSNARNTAMISGNAIRHRP